MLYSLQAHSGPSLPSHKHISEPEGTSKKTKKKTWLLRKLESRHHHCMTHIQQNNLVRIRLTPSSAKLLCKERKNG